MKGNIKKKERKGRRNERKERRKTNKNKKGGSKTKLKEKNELVKCK